MVFLQNRRIRLLTPGLDNTRLFMSLTAGAGTRSMVISLHYQAFDGRKLSLFSILEMLHGYDSWFYL